MTYSLTKHTDVLAKDKFDIHLDIYQNIGDSGVVIAETKTGHNQEFYHTVSIFNYIILSGEGSFYLDDDEVTVTTGDLLSIPPNTRIYYKGDMRLLLITNPAWTEENEIETRPSIW